MNVSVASRDGAFHTAVFAPVDGPFGSAGEASVGIAPTLKAEVGTVGAGSAFGQPGVVGSNGGGDVVFIDWDIKLLCHRTGVVPGVHLHIDQLHVVFIHLVVEVSVTELVQEGEFAVVAFDAFLVVDDGSVAGGVHKVTARNENLIREFS